MAISKRTTQGLTLGAAALALALMPACSGKSSGPSAVLYTGVLTGTDVGGGTMYGVVLPTGATRWLAGDLSMVSTTLSLKGSALQGTASLYSPTLPLASSSGPQQLTVTGTSDAASLKAVLTNSSGTATTYSFTPDTAANTSVALATLAGTYTATTTSGSEAANITISSDGGLVGSSGSNGLLAGTLTAAPNAPNAFNVTLTYTAVGGSPSQSLTGLAYYRPGNPAQLVLMADDGTSEYSGVFGASAAAAVAPAEGKR